MREIPAGPHPRSMNLEARPASPHQIEKRPMIVGCTCDCRTGVASFLKEVQGGRVE